MDSNTVCGRFAGRHLSLLQWFPVSDSCRQAPTRSSNLSPCLITHSNLPMRAAANCRVKSGNISLTMMFLSFSKKMYRVSSGQVWWHTPETHLATVLLWPPSGHRPGRCQAHHVRILQIGIRLAIAQADARPSMSVSFRQASVWPGRHRACHAHTSF